MKRAMVMALGLSAVEPERPGSLVGSGDRLIYESGGARMTWEVDSVAAGAEAACGTVWIRRDGTGEERRDCVRGDALFRWDARASAWTEQRPVAPNVTRSYPRRGAGRVEYRTGNVVLDTISGRIIAAVETTVTTFDSTGAARRRLRERYSVGLTTATGGVFEVADGDGGWTVERSFRLVAIER